MSGEAPVRLGPGAYRIQAEAYHADPCEVPSLSASIASKLLTWSPRHAWVAHPRLNPNHTREHDSKFDLGSAAHALLLGDEAMFAVVDAADWRTKIAQAAKEQAYADGKIPLLREQFDRTRDMVAAARAQLVNLRDGSGRLIGDPFTDGVPETTLIWRDRPAGDAGEPILCRSLLDYCRHDPSEPWYDYKTTSGAANPDALTARLLGTGADIQDALYTRGIRAVFDVERPIFRFVVQEIEEPFALSVVELHAAAKAVADKKVDEALALWRRCNAENIWPGYPTRVATIEMPGWHEQRQMEREMRGEVDREARIDTFQLLSNWQAPNRTRGMLEASVKEISQ